MPGPGCRGDSAEDMVTNLPSEETFQQSNGNQNAPIPKKSSFCPTLLCTPALLLPLNTRRSSCESKWGDSWGGGAEITQPGSSQRCQCRDKGQWPQTETLEMPLQTRKTLFWGWLDTRTVLAHGPGQPPVAAPGWAGVGWAHPRGPCQAVTQPQTMFLEEWQAWKGLGQHRDVVSKGQTQFQIRK